MSQSIKLFFLAFLISTLSIGQTFEESTENNTKFENLDKKTKWRFQKFKKSTTTIFVWSDVIEKEVYENLLKEYWTITPYKIISAEEFNLEDYRSDEYSFGRIWGYKKNKTTKMGSKVSSIYTYFKFSVYGKDKKSSKKSREIPVTLFRLYPNDSFVFEAIKSTESAGEMMNRENAFHNYTSGFLKNYLQYYNKRILTEKEYFHDSQLAKLATETLYLPYYLNISVDAFTGIENANEDKNNSIFNNYNYKYKFIDNDEMNSKILNNEKFYYLRYIRLNSSQIYQIVNSNTGDIVYKEQYDGLSYNVKKKHLQKLNKAIKNAAD